MRVVVRAMGPRHRVISRFTIKGHNIEVQSLDNGNVFATWGCGSDCLNSALYTPYGVKLASLWFPVLSSDSRFALERDVLNLEPGDVKVAIVGLRTGKKTNPVLYPGLYNCTGERTSATEVTFSTCPHGQVVSIPFVTSRAMKR
jgi:hypothetical protein